MLLLLLLLLLVASREVCLIEKRNERGESSGCSLVDIAE